MLQVRRDREIHREDGGWFQARWHFSFDRYRDPEPMEFLQLWILPDTVDLTPSVQQRQFLKAQRTDTLLQVVGAAGEDLVTVHQDAAVFVAALSAGKEVTHRFGSKRAGYLYLIEG